MKSKFAICAVAILTLSLAVSAFGQTGPRTYGSSTGFGSILFPGTGGPPPLTSSGAARQAPIFNPGGLTFPERLSGNIQGKIYPSGQGRGRGNTVVVPYAVPVYYGGGYGYGSGYYPQQESPNLTIVQQPSFQPATPSSPVVINQYFSQAPSQTQAQTQTADNGSLRLYEAAPTPQPETPAVAPAAAKDDKPAIYLIAFKGGAIYPTLAYWVEGDTLQYITMDKNLNKASLDLIDRDLSTRLNVERHVDFSLPNSK